MNSETFVVNVDCGLDDDTGHKACFEEIVGDSTLMPWKMWLEKGWIVPKEASVSPRKLKLTKDAVVTAEEK